MTPVVAFRANGGVAVGLGHLRRCATLAQALQGQGARVFFVADDAVESAQLLEDERIEVIRTRADEIRRLDRTVDEITRRGAHGLVVDSYDITAQALTTVPIPVAAIVDAAPERPLPVRLLINGAVDAPLTPFTTRADTELLLGTPFVLLRRAFADARREAVRDRVERVLITTGGSDASHWTPRLARIVQQSLPHVTADVIVGPYFPSAVVRELEDVAASRRVTLHHCPGDVVSLMLAADLAVTGGGQTVYELAATGTPAVAIAIANNQRVNLTGLESRGTLIHAGDAGDPDIENTLACRIKELAGDRALRDRMSRAGRDVVDGRGAQRVAARLFDLLVNRES